MVKLRLTALFLGVVFMKGGNLRLSYLGAQNQVYSWTKLDTQAEWLAQVLSGRIQLPSRDAMEQDIQDWMAKEAGCQSVPDIICMQSDYLLDLARAANLGEDEVRQLDARDMFQEWFEVKTGEGEGKGVHRFRQGAYRSRITGEMAAMTKGQ